jgi:hypothetical protein
MPRDLKAVAASVEPSRDRKSKTKATTSADHDIIEIE